MNFSSILYSSIFYPTLLIKHLWKYIFKFLFCLLLFIGCANHDKLEVLEGYALGTKYHVKYASKTLNSEKTSNGLDSIFSVINNSMSTYLPSSLISRFNRDNTSLRVDEHFETVFRVSEEIWTKTDGYFDPTVGPLVDAYGFGSDGYVPINYEHLDSLKRFIGLDKVKLENKVLTKQYAEVSLDFNAIAKGYAIDLIGLYFTNKKTDNFLIEIGGEVLVRGHNPESNKPWSIGIENPIVDSLPKILRVVELKDKAQATSGNYRKFLIDSLTGEEYTHIVNPITGELKPSNLLSVSVTANTCIKADALATALMVMPIDKGKELVANEDDVEALWILSGEDNQTILHQSTGFGK
ncbi:MAG: FAD:protein FMN transferase [Flavobacteriaceae bacterium]|nr:FAD:protein FMN transferase [Flavobacteriaceae bacterium]